MASRGGMMGGSGGGGGFRYGSEVGAARERARRIAAEETQRGDVNELLDELLAEYNNRPIEATREKLDEIEDVLAEQDYDITRLLFGGSVAKRTYVEGLSDVDSLIYIRDGDGAPAEILADLVRDLTDTLTGATSVSAGAMAVTVVYRDGTKVQLLPAIERNGRTQVPDSEGRGWVAIRPHKFTEKLTEVNQHNSGRVVPAIKLVKSALDSLPDVQRLAGYHIEALAVDAFRSYNGQTDRASMVEHLLGHAAQAVMRPTGDITGQTVHIDQHLGPSGSAQRREISRALSGRLAALRTATSAERYRAILEGDD